MHVGPAVYAVISLNCSHSLSHALVLCDACYHCIITIILIILEYINPIPLQFVVSRSSLVTTTKLHRICMKMKCIICWLTLPSRGHFLSGLVVNMPLKLCGFLSQRHKKNNPRNLESMNIYGTKLKKNLALCQENRTNPSFCTCTWCCFCYLFPSFIWVCTDLFPDTRTNLVKTASRTWSLAADNGRRLNGGLAWMNEGVNEWLKKQCAPSKPPSNQL